MPTTTTPALTAPATSTATSPEAGSNARTRLHITPFNPSLLEKIIPPTVLPQATGISYHSVQTFPEKGFGYVELPTMEAEKIKKKLNGSILKGSKIRIEEAKPLKRRQPESGDEGDVATGEERQRKAKRSKSEKRKEKIIDGVELPAERSVKRGWTATPAEVKEKKKKDKDKKDKKDKKKQAKHVQVSQYTTEPEMLFRTSLPPNVAAALPEKEVKKKGKDKKSKAGKDVVVHEFAHTTKHAAFLKTSQIPKDSKRAAEYVEGKGWVDEEGNVLEPEVKSKRPKTKAPAPSPKPSATSKPVLNNDQGTKGADKAASTEKKGKKSKSKKIERQATPESESESDASSILSTSSSDVSSISSSSDAQSESESNPESDASESSSDSESDADSTTSSRSQPKATSASTAPSDKPATATDQQKKDVHPLEALFKRPAPTSDARPSTATQPAPINTSFSFFGGGGEDDDDNNGDETMADDVAIPEASASTDNNTRDPHTPYTKQDMQFRSLRSGAPTPDTAAIGGRFRTPWGAAADEYPEDEEEEEEEDPGQRDGAAAGGRAAEKDEEEGKEEESEFAKWFWENRGETNRAWKKRRREALKARRQRENRKAGRKVV